MEPMMNGAHRKDDPETSKEAAALDISELEARVYGLLKFKPLTAEELAFSLNKSLQSITPRIAPLRRRGFIFDSGIRRRGQSGRSRIVWAAATEIIPEPVKTQKLEEKEILQIASRHTKYMTGKTAWAMDVVSLIRELEARWNIK
jgi:predicted transcriptional regulator